MFWTTLVRGWNKVFLVLGIIASVITGIALMGEIGPLSLLIIPVGIIFCFVSISVIMMISEISVSLHELNEKNSYNQNDNDSTLRQSENNSIMYQKAESVTHNKFKEKLSEKPSKKPRSKIRVDDSWVCKCGTRNPNTAKYCKNCGTCSTDVASTDTSAYGNT